MTQPPLIIAIDGPSGSGKSSVSLLVAQRLGIGYLDTGAMYRALAWWCSETGVDLDDAAAVAEAARQLPLDISTNPDDPKVAVDGTDITRTIRESAISAIVSKVARIPEVRASMIARQRALIEASAQRYGGVVAEGRDITTVVAPDAPVRIVLTASEEARLKRRAQDVHGQVDEASMAATHDEVVRRDRDDSTVTSFMEAAPGVELIDTSDLDFSESIEAVLTVVRESDWATA